MEKNKLGLQQLLLIAFAVSGMTVLIYEVVWTRPLQLIFGSTVYAVSTMLMTFMFGFAFGSYLFRNIADKSKNPAKLFAALEFGIGLYGLMILALFKILPTIYISLLYVPGFQFIQLALCFLVLIVPTTMMGAVWPVINKAYVNLEVVGKDAGILYSFNSFGSFLGPLAAGFLLIPLLGITMSCILTALLNIIIGISVFLYAKNNLKEEKK